MEKASPLKGVSYRVPNVPKAPATRQIPANRALFSRH